MLFLLAESQDFSPEAASILGRIGELKRYDEKNQALAEAVKFCDVLLVRLRYNIDARIIEAAKNLRFIVSPTTGLDHIDLDAAAKRDIQVVSLQGEKEFLKSVSSTAELTWGLLLSVVRRIPAAHASVAAGQWNRDCFWGMDLYGLKLGILGLGRLGTKVAEYGRAFGMHVGFCDPYVPDSHEKLLRYPTAAALAADSDILSVHVPLNGSTLGLVGHEVLSAMGPGGIVINTSRGAVVDQNALLDLLEKRLLGGAGLDVIQDESGALEVRNERLLKYIRENHNLVVTPHIGGATLNSIHRAEVFVANKLARIVLNQRA